MFSNRRKKVIQSIRNQIKKDSNAALLICAGFENHKYKFRQESSFYYLTGISEPAVILCCYFDGPDILYVPFYNQSREQWVHSKLSVASQPQKFGVDQIKYQGEQISGYSCPPFFTQERYAELIADLKENLGKVGVVYTLMDDRGWRYFHQMQLAAKLQEWLADRDIKMEDAANFVHNARRVKDDGELGLIRRAVEVTSIAHSSVAKSIKQGMFEYQIQGMIDYLFKEQANCDPAFPSIVASGVNTTVLHSDDNSRQFQNGDLVVVDIGAEYGMYAADITRTYPVGGKFTSRQKEVYSIVLQTQEYVQSLAKPGIYLNNRDVPENSLHHLAVKFLQQLGYDKYFVHGIGHFLGLDVHDVADHTVPMQVGDVFTIEPGIYISNENLGIRIEDDFVITKSGCDCLSKNLVKSIEEIEDLMKDR